jgi:hypothetical protein
VNPSEEREPIIKAVKLDFNEELPDQPQRASRFAEEPGIAGIRLRIEGMILQCNQIEPADLHELGEEGRRLLYRMITEPTEQDYPYRRELVTMLGMYDDVESVTLLASVATDPRENEVIIGRALEGLAVHGGKGATRIIVNALEHDNTYVRNRALRALLHLRNPETIPVLRKTLEQHPSANIRRRVYTTLREMNIDVAPPDLEEELAVPEKRIAQEE